MMAPRGSAAERDLAANAVGYTRRRRLDHDKIAAPRLLAGCHAVEADRLTRARIPDEAGMRRKQSDDGEEADEKARDEPGYVQIAAPRHDSIALRLSHAAWRSAV